jgi:hypothetical protein
MLKLPFIRAFSSCNMGCPARLLFGGHERAARLNGSGYRMTIAAPPIEPSEQFFGAKSQPRKFVSALGRGVTADPIAINDIDLAAVEARRRFPIHLAMWEVDRTGNVAGDVCITRARVNHNDSGKACRTMRSRSKRAPLTMAGATTPVSNEEADRLLLERVEEIFTKYPIVTS